MSQRLSFMKVLRVVAVLLVIAGAGAPPAHGECYLYENSRADRGSAMTTIVPGTPRTTAISATAGPADTDTAFAHTTTTDTRTASTIRTRLEARS